ncbi:MAG: acyltransferase [Candidatus Aegiribacteria sp. MLS_C]|nr:MAG: acyltransferase [Candidatus Aegiribacteria sp. MLS_C]
MLFNSLAFWLFLPAVFIIYWELQRCSLRVQNLFLLAASYFFYGWWDWRFLLLIFASSLTDYLVGMGLGRTGIRSSRRRMLLWTSLFINLGLLGFFKYFNFFVSSVARLLTQFGMEPHLPVLNVILPVGISFYTFQTLSYTIDIYRGKVKPVNDPVAFFAFVSFFPQLVAGPVERAKTFLPQFLERRRFDPATATDGMRQILWGLLKKMVVADNIGRIVDVVFSHSDGLNWVGLLIGGTFFSIQIYCDFSGYTDIAIGAARLFGFSLMRNFAYPYFSRNLTEFWSRWNISVSSWFRDYVYIPLGGSRVSDWRHIANLVITFTVSGLWHGAAWTFIIWGLAHGVLYCLTMVTGHNTKYDDVVARGRLLPSVGEAWSMFLTLVPVIGTAIVFRAQSIGGAWRFLSDIATFRGGLDLGMGYFAEGLVMSAVLFGVEWLQRSRKHGLEIDFMPRTLRWAVYYACVAVLVLYGNFGQQEFIYFHF